MESNKPSTSLGTPSFLYVTPATHELLKALFSIANDPYRPDLAIQHINASVAMQEKNIYRNTEPPTTLQEMGAELRILYQQLNELDFTLEVLDTFKKSVNKVITEINEKSKK